MCTSVPNRANACVGRHDGWAVGCVRSGLASHAVARAVLSGAAMGHDQVRDGAGWFHGALDHAHTLPSNQLSMTFAQHHLYHLPKPDDVVTTVRRQALSLQGNTKKGKRENRPRPLGRLGSSRLPAV